MFPNDTNPENHSFVFAAAFHLGIPLAICQTRNSSGWLEIKDELEAKFLEHPDVFQIVPFDAYESITKYPLGRPLIIRHLDFFRIYNLPRIFQDEGFALSDDSYKLDHLVWLCPSGVVLLIGRISFLEEKSPIAFEQFENEIMWKHYEELTYVFTEIAKTVFSVIPVKVLNSSICSAIDLANCRKAIGFREEFLGSLSSNSTFVDATVFLKENVKAFYLYQDMLIDIYFVNWMTNEPNVEYSANLEYTFATVTSPDPVYLRTIGIAFSSFIGLVWLQKHLSEQSQVLQQVMIGDGSLGNEISVELKLFRSFCLQFMNESQPISVRLTHDYLDPVEEFWGRSRMNLLVRQINEQLATLEEMYKWIEEIKKEARNLKIGLAAILLTLISLTAVAAQLISTIDVKGQLGADERIVLIAVGFIVGILTTLVIYLLPISRQQGRIKIRRNKKK